MVARALRWLSPFAAAALRLDTPTQCVHEIDDLGRLALSRRLYLLARLLLLQQLLDRIPVLVLELLRLEMRFLRINDVGGEFDMSFGTFSSGMSSK
jgi:hypothetical protein